MNRVTSVPVRKYDLTYLSTNAPLSGEVSSVHELVAATGPDTALPIAGHPIDVCMLDIQLTCMAKPCKARPSPCAVGHAWGGCL